MKRTELVVGTDYVTDKGLKVTVKDTAPGWTVTDGTPERDTAVSTRFMSNKGTQSEYQVNVNILVDWTRSDGSVVPLALAPRALRATWADYQAAPDGLKDLLLKYGMAEYLKRREDFEYEEGAVDALHKRWLARFQAAGVVAPDVALSKDAQHVTVDAADLNKVLLKAGV